MGREGDDLPGARVTVRNTPEPRGDFFTRRIERFGLLPNPGLGAKWVNLNNETH
jgi:hypothetical protein